MSLVAIVGRPNVGKSTLFNRLVGERKAIVDATAGTTRDRHYGKTDWNGREFSIIDTGGYTVNSDDVFEDEIRRQVLLAIDEADVILFVVEVSTGITDLDALMADILRRTSKKVLLICNKVDNNDQIYSSHEFYSLGLGDPYCISSMTGSGTGDMMDAILAALPAETKAEEEDGTTVRAGAAASLSSVCAFARDKGLTGLEFAWGIPGSVGGAVYMDAGAYGGETRDVVNTVTHMTPAGRLETVSGSGLAFGYRKSRYTGGKDVILWARYTLSPGDPRQIAAEMEELMDRRKSKQPYEMPSAGSVFKRPQNGYAAALIEECGLKGTAVGGAQVSEKHAGFIVNTGGASCRDVLKLVEIVRERVLTQKGVELEPEVRMIGEA